MKKHVDLFFFLLLGGLLWKAFFLHQHNHLSPDGAMIGLMARHIQEGIFPIFFYGYGYIGSLKSFIASVLFTFFGTSAQTLLLLPTLFYIGFSVTTYWLVSLIADRKAARIAMLFTLLASQWLTLFSAEIVGAYMDTLFYGNLLLIFLHQFCFGKEQHKWKWSLALGTTAGLAFWQFPLSGYYLVTIGLSLFVFRPKNIFSKTLPLFGFSFLIGSAPFWVYNFYHDFVSFRMVQTASFTQFMAHVHSFFTYYIPSILGWGFQAENLAHHFGWITIGALLFISLIWLFKKTLRHFYTPEAPILFLFFVTFILFARNNYVGERSPMVALPMLFIFPVAIGLFLSFLSKKTKLVFWGLLFILIPLYGLETYASSIGRQQNAFHFNQAQDKIENEIRAANLDFVYAPYTIAPIISFKTEEKIKLGNLLEEPIPFYKESLDTSERPGFLFKKDQGEAFEQNLIFLGCSFKKREVENHLLFYDIKKTLSQGKEILPTKWQGDRDTFDRNWVTRWTPHVPQRPGQNLEIDLGQTHRLTGLELRSIERQDLPRSLKVEISQNKKRWEEVASLPFTPTPLYFSGTHPFSDLEQGRLEVSFKPIKARFVRLTQTSKSDISYWSIHEIYFFEAEDPSIPQNPKAEIDSLINVLQAYKEQPIYADTWLNAQFSLNPKMNNFKFISLYNPRLNLTRLKPVHERLSRYIDWDQKPVFVVHQDKQDSFESSPIYNAQQWKQEKSGPWRLYQQKETPKTEWKPLSKEKWKASANPHPERADRAIAQPNKSWESFDSQKQGMSFTLNLGQIESFSKVELTTGLSFWEYPRHFKLYASNNNQDWKEIPIFKMGLPYWDGIRLVPSQLHQRTLPILIESTQTQYLKIKLTQDFPRSQWSISNINILN